MKHEKKQRVNKNAVMAIFIAVIMTSSIMGYIWNSTKETFSYNNYKFEREGNYFSLKLNNQVFKFYYFPLDIENINLSNEAVDRVKNTKMVYFTFDPESKSIDYIDKARFDLNTELGKIDVWVGNGKTLESDEYTFPTINCENATEHVPVIYFKDSNTTRFSLENNCLIGESNSKEGFLALKDRLLYAILGII